MLIIKSVPCFQYCVLDLVFRSPVSVQELPTPTPPPPVCTFYDVSDTVNLIAKTSHSKCAQNFSMTSRLDRKSTGDDSIFYSEDSIIKDLNS